MPAPTRVAVIEVARERTRIPDLSARGARESGAGDVVDAAFGAGAAAAGGRGAATDRHAADGANAAGRAGTVAAHARRGASVGGERCIGGGRCVGGGGCIGGDRRIGGGRCVGGDGSIRARRSVERRGRIHGRRRIEGGGDVGGSGVQVAGISGTACERTREQKSAEGEKEAKRKRSHAPFLAGHRRGRRPCSPPSFGRRSLDERGAARCYNGPCP